ncbi:hypothetical protein BCR39DRAFT_551657 [Naematelia encephala]|uniref:BTB domain-containing protein n=1 Tax=Naematelia encephala TaxID=71784 RepID=A0A1Y2AJH1_9TREE|nr:hypothetical protein BCR39DRAFT_551657 [Naematelia encephala]
MDLTLADLNDGARSWPSVERRVSESTDVWARDLRSVFEHAKDRFGDVSWESEEGSERIWGHKAMIYARAPKAFKDRSFITRHFARSPTSLRSPSPSSNFAPPPSPYPPSFRLNAPGRSSSLSVDTLRPPLDSSQVLRLTHGDTPELFAAQLEWLYTGEGFGDVVEWISAEDDSGLGASIRDSLGRRGNQAERQDKLGQDLTYMWRSKLYADVRIHLAPIHELDAEGSAEDSLSDDSEESTDSLSSTAVFTAHKFILASRSPYFTSLLLNTAAFKPLGGSGATADIHLPTPPFTPAALHFCLGYMYAGHLDFSNRTFDLLTAFQIHRAAAYLQLDTLTNEIEARIANDFCHGLDLSKCHCRRCPMRAARVWRFASEPDVGAVALAKRAREYVLRGWGDSWGREVGSADDDQRSGLVRDTIARIGPGKVVSAFKAIAQIQARMEAGIRARAREAAAWVDPLQEMLEKIQEHTRTVLLNDFAAVADAGELWQLALGKGFNDDLLDILVKEIVDVVGTPRGCVEGPHVYQVRLSQ